MGAANPGRGCHGERRMSMKKPVFCVLVVLFVVVLGACGKSTPQSAETINPGDKVGDFLITTGGQEGVKNVWDLGCEESTGKCSVPLGTKVNTSWGIYADASKGEDLETKWAGHTYEMVIDGRPVNLQAFGTVDFDHPYVGKIRCWDVVVTSDKPGEIEIKGTGALAGETTESDVTTLIFTAP
jgi:hypothetical protein